MSSKDPSTRLPLKKKKLRNFNRKFLFKLQIVITNAYTPNCNECHMKMKRDLKWPNNNAFQRCLPRNPFRIKLIKKRKQLIALKIIAVLRFDTKAKAYFLFFSIKTFSEPLNDRCVTIYCFESLYSSP